jgi:hypothetical protein
MNRTAIPQRVAGEITIDRVGDAPADAAIVVGDRKDHGTHSAGATIAVDDRRVAALRWTSCGALSAAASARMTWDREASDGARAPCCRGTVVVADAARRVRLHGGGSRRTLDRPAARR